MHKRNFFFAYLLNHISIYLYLYLFLFVEAGKFKCLITSKRSSESFISLCVCVRTLAHLSACLSTSTAACLPACLCACVLVCLCVSVINKLGFRGFRFNSQWILFSFNFFSFPLSFLFLPFPSFFIFF